MKKTFLLLPIALMSITALASCKSSTSKEHITYGTYVDTEIKKLSYADLEDKIDNKSENFLLAMYYGEDSHCSCWATFRTVLTEYVQTYNTVVYKIDRFSFNDYNKENASKWGLVLMDEDRPEFYYFQRGKLKKRFKYNVDALMFKNLDALNSEINKIASKPNIYYVDAAYLSNKLFTEKEEVVVHYIRKTCPDCQYCAPRVVEPYYNTTDVKVKAYMFDLDPIRSTNMEEYVATKDQFGLSTINNPTYGFGGGVVPTVQYIKDGKVKDMTVYLNDTVELVNDKYVVTDSYYTEERIQNLHYLDNVEVKVIKGMEIPSENYHSGWDKSAASYYHDPILKAFLHTYAK